MPKVDFCFSGWVRGAEITQAGDTDVSDMSSEELTEKLKKGELCISLGDYLYDNNDASEIEIDFDTGGNTITYSIRTSS